MLLTRKISSSVWSIKVYPADSPVLAEPVAQEMAVPTIRAADVTDIKAEFVADPFLIQSDGRFYLFYEALDKKTGRGVIALSVSDDGLAWRYERVVLTESFHLSYPQVFEWEGSYYMVPESVGANQVLLYKATRFPCEWEAVGGLLEGRYTDPSLFRYEGKWWMFAGARSTELHLFYADRLEGPWRAHPKSPLLSDNRSISRPGGRVLVQGELIYRYAQDEQSYYGQANRVIRVTRLTETDYEEEAGAEVLTGSGKTEDWRSEGMHHIDQLQLSADRWLIAVDGHRNNEQWYLFWKIGRLLRKITVLLA